MPKTLNKKDKVKPIVINKGDKDKDKDKEIYNYVNIGFCCGC